MVSVPDVASGPVDRWVALLHLAEAQHGAFSRADAAACGVTARMLRRALDRDRVERCAPNAFRLCGAPRTWEQHLVLACAALGHGSVASRRSAGVLNQFPGYRSGIIEVTSDQHRTQRIQGVVAHYTSRWLPEDLTSVDGIRCTDPYRTFIDLGADLSERHHEELLDALEHAGIIERAQLEDRLARIRVQGRNGVGYTARLLERRSSIRRLPTNALERRFLRIVEHAGLPTPECQVSVRLPDGTIAVLDFLWPVGLLAVETDGHGSHATRTARAHDNRRSAALLELGIEVIRFTWEDVQDDPQAVAGSLRRNLERRRSELEAGRLVVAPAVADALHARRAS
jgi:hypothetical protein